LIREVNEAVRAATPAGSYFVDLEQISGSEGRQSFYDPRGYFRTKQPFSRVGVMKLCEHLWAGIRAVLRRIRA
jgi:hypothetical protein